MYQQLSINLKKCAQSTDIDIDNGASCQSLDKNQFISFFRPAEPYFDSPRGKQRQSCRRLLQRIRLCRTRHSRSWNPCSQHWMAVPKSKFSTERNSYQEIFGRSRLKLMIFKATFARDDGDDKKSIGSVKKSRWRSCNVSRSSSLCSSNPMINSVCTSRHQKHQVGATPTARGHQAFRRAPLSRHPHFFFLIA